MMCSTKASGGGGGGGVHYVFKSVLELVKP